MDMLSKVAEFGRRHKLLSSGDRILIAVSGGPDSVALLQLLYDLHEEFSLHLEVAHMEHGMRGEEAREDARFVAALAEKFNLPFHLREVSVPQIRSAMGRGNLEQLARDERYGFFAEVAGQRKINKIATGHTEDDQAETVLMRFFRGFGRRGLGGMSPLRPLVNRNDDLLLIRPLLGVSKAEILEFFNQRRIDYRIDRTNRDTTLLRNWLRFELLPQLWQRVDHRLAPRLAQDAEVMRDEDEFLGSLGRQELERIRAVKGINRTAFLSLRKAMQRRVLRLWIEEARGHLREIDFAHIEDFLKFIADRTPQGRVAIPAGWELLKEYDLLRLQRYSRSRKAICYSYHLPIDASLNILEAGMTIRSERFAPPLARLPDKLMEAVFDAAVLAEPLMVRNFRRGDRFIPLGMAGHKKVKDLFIEKKVPLSVRAVLPLLSIGDEILWIPGYGRSEIGKVHSQTSSILRLIAVSVKC
jgi:tRNA(Ile)-lysidine synthase